MDYAKKIKKLEQRVQNEAFSLLKVLSKDKYRNERLQIVDSVSRSGSKLIHNLGFIRQAISIYAKNGRLSDAKELAERHLACSDLENKNKATVAFQDEYQDICRRLASGNSSPEPTPHFYDAIYSRSEEYQQQPEESVYFEVWSHVLSLIKMLMPTKVIDIGCGPGQFAQYFINEYKQGSYTGIDTSPLAISQAKQRVEKGSFAVSKLEDLDSQIVSNADCFIALEVLEHIEKDIELMRLIPSDKELIFSVPNFDSFGHIRYFMNPSQVEARYGFIFSTLTIKTVATSSSSSIYLGHGTIL